MFKNKSYIIYLFINALIISFGFIHNNINIENVDPRMEKYFSRDFQEKINLEKARKVTLTDEDDLTLSDEDLKNAKAPLMYSNFECKTKIHVNEFKGDEMNNNNYSRIMKRYSMFLLYLTATWCDYCCQHNVELLKLKDILKDKTYEGEEIPIVIMYSNNSVEAIKDLNITFFKVPTLFLVKNKKFYQFSSYFRSLNIYRFINNILYPYIELNSIQEVEDFMDTTKELNNEQKSSIIEDNEFLSGYPPKLEHLFFENLYQNRLIGFFADPEEYSSELENFKNYAELISHRNELRIALTTNRDVIKHFKQKYEGVWFNSHSWNSIVLKRQDKSMFLDLSLVNEHLEIFMIYNTIPYIEELSINNTKLLAKVSTPVVLFFIDTSFILDNYYYQIKFLEVLSKDYVGKYVFMYLDGNTKTKTKEIFGLKKDTQIPNFTIMYISSNKFKNTPQSFPYSDIFIKKFLDKHLRSNTKYGSELEYIREKNISSSDSNITVNLKSTTKLKPNNVNLILKNKNKNFDIVVFVIDTDYDEKSLVYSKYIKKLCDRLKYLGIHSTLVATFDVNEHGNNYKFENYLLSVGKIFLVKAKSKNIVMYNSKISTYRLMNFIEKNAEIKIKFPELPHLDPELHEEYYNKKSLLESYDENINKSDEELDDVIDMDLKTDSAKDYYSHIDL